MNNQSPPKIWIYARHHCKYIDAMDQYRFLTARVKADDELSLIGSSVDVAHRLFHRKGLMELLKAVKRQKIDAVWITHLHVISRRPFVAYWVLRQLQRHHVELYTTNSNLEYELNLMGIDKKLIKKSLKKDGFVPWRRGIPFPLEDDESFPEQ